MKILEDLLNGKEKNIDNVAAEIVKLNAKLAEKRGRLYDVKKELADHHRKMAIGKGDSRLGEELQQKAFFIEGEVGGLLEVIAIVSREGEVIAADKISRVKEDEISLRRRGNKERDDIQACIVKECAKLYLLTRKLNGRKDGTIHYNLSATQIPWFAQYDKCGEWEELKKQMESESKGPYFTELEERQLKHWLETATPNNVLFDAIAKAQNEIGE